MFCWLLTFWGVFLLSSNSSLNSSQVLLGCLKQTPPDQYTITHLDSGTQQIFYPKFELLHTRLEVRDDNSTHASKPQTTIVFLL